jgi:hypothetical protein
MERYSTRWILGALSFVSYVFEALYVENLRKVGDCYKITASTYVFQQATPTPEGLRHTFKRNHTSFPPACFYVFSRVSLVPVQRNNHLNSQEPLLYPSYFFILPECLNSWEVLVTIYRNILWGRWILSINIMLYFCRRVRKITESDY